MSLTEKTSSLIHIPSCPKCKGDINIKIQPLNFSIEFECENNESHNKDNIFFKTFEKFYLKEHTLMTCSKCKISLENSESFNCDICKNIYCCKCYFDDIQVNEHTSSKIKIHNNRCIPLIFWNFI